MKIPTWFIEAAIRGGWVETQRALWSEYKVVLDPQFWRCLGKELGWIDKDYPNGEMRCTMERCDMRYCDYAGYKDPIEQAQMFFSLILSKASPEALDAFWEALRPKV